MYNIDNIAQKGCAQFQHEKYIHPLRLHAKDCRTNLLEKCRYYNHIFCYIEMKYPIQKKKQEPLYNIRDSCLNQNLLFNYYNYQPMIITVPASNTPVFIDPVTLTFIPGVTVESFLLF